LGRHFRFNDYSKLIVGRNHGENELLFSLALNTDYLIQTIDIPGPMAILRISDRPDLRKHKKLLLSSIGITLRYSDVLPEKNCKVKVTNNLSRTNKIISSLPFSVAEVERYRI
jgi:tRNA-specific 2-thiouridylase